MPPRRSRCGRLVRRSERVKDEGIPFGSGPGSRTDDKINHEHRGRGFYFECENGHVWEANGPRMLRIEACNGVAGKVKGVLCGFWIPAFAGMTEALRDDGRWFARTAGGTLRFVNAECR